MSILLSKTRLSILIACFIIVQCFAIPFAEAPLFAAEKSSVQVIFGDRTISFDATPYLSKKVLMVPAKEAMEKLGLQVRALNNDKTLVGYKNNVYIKIVAGKYGYRNGKSYRYKTPSVIKNDILYMPLSFLTKSYDYDLVEKSGVYTISHIGSSGRFTLMNDIYYKTYDISPYDVSLSIPDYWEKSKTSDLKFSYKDDYENSLLEISTAPRMSGDFSKLVENYIESSILLQNKYTVKSVNRQRLDLFDSALITASNTLSESNETLYLYLIRAETQLYILKFTDRSTSSVNQPTTLYRNIAKSFKVNRLSVDYSSEYYIEYDAYNTYGFKSETPLYSSITVENIMSLKGTLNNKTPYDRLVAYVKRGSESSYFTVQIKNDQFSGKIYTPFGLGRHQITLFFVPNTADASTYEKYMRSTQYKVLEFSVVNTAFNTLKYLIPSTLVNADDPAIVNTATAKTYKHLKRIDKARDIYKWLVNVYTLKSTKVPQPATTILKGLSGDERDLNILYAALLRATGIPTRIVTGEYRNATVYWTEIEINGIWIVSDIVSGYHYKEDEKLSHSHFSLNLRQFYEKRESIKQLDY